MVTTILKKVRPPASADIVIATALGRNMENIKVATMDILAPMSSHTMSLPRAALIFKPIASVTDLPAPDASLPVNASQQVATMNILISLTMSFLCAGLISEVAAPRLRPRAVRGIAATRGIAAAHGVAGAQGVAAAHLWPLPPMTLLVLRSIRVIGPEGSVVSL